ncbi:O-methyltransferase [Kutzneria buriramensis]|uniref:Catechol O-methyltransferase n=1 Tax=Kutzneria buriramensis TaxID=1045776 RepID=A0A3E0GY51_9PSEU|nr:O-methyltransferase [Kutzneria buriramensis]REH33128.1 catechol O-methyltransferase [Kutzneria buriramensis]
MNPLELVGKRVPFLRWSFLRLLFSFKKLTTEWQVGDGREEALAHYVVTRARAGDVDDVIRTIDEFCARRSFMIHVSEEKGAILDAAVRRTSPKRVLELGTYCGYSALRIVRLLDADCRLVSVEFNPANADIARRIWDHAGVGSRVAVVVGTLGDGDVTLKRLEVEHGFAPGSVDFVFIDHAKDAYLPDLHRVVDRDWLHAGSVVVADNVKFPGAPEYRAYMKSAEGRTWRSIEHATHETLIRDVVLESRYLGNNGVKPSPSRP